MKKIGFMVLVSVALLSLGMASCASLRSWQLGSKKLDISTLDPARPIPVYQISLPEEGKKTTDQLEPAEADRLLELVCGSAAKNWEAITKRFTAETGLTLNGDDFMSDLEYGDSSKITVTNTKALSGMDWHYYTWDNTYAVDGPFAYIEFRYSGNEIVPYWIAVMEYDLGEETGMGENVRRHIIYWDD
jgi:hypothetical protein